MSDLLKTLLDAAATLFPDDTTSPGIHLSKLKNGTYYGALKRYDGPFGRQPETLVAARQSTPEQTLEALANWILARENDVIGRLNVLIKEKKGGRV